MRTIYQGLEERKPYPGLLAMLSKDCSHQMIFFDDGHVQKVKSNDIRMGFDSHNLDHVHSNAEKYFKFYQSLDMHHEIRPSKGNVMKIELNGNWVRAEAVDIDADLPMAQFRLTLDNQPDRYEWLYFGSPRIDRVWRKLVEGKLLDKLFNFVHFDAECHNDDEDLIIIDRCVNEVRASRRIEKAPESDGKKMSDDHECSHACVSLERDYKDKIEEYSLFHRPLVIGFKRDDTTEPPFYTSPCNRKLKSYADIRAYLSKVDSDLRVESFSFEKGFNPSENRKLPNRKRIVEVFPDKMKIPVCTDEPFPVNRKFNYITESCLKIDGIEKEKSLNRCCNCTDNCVNKFKCSCWRLTMERSLGKKPKLKQLKGRKNTVGYSNFRLLNQEINGIVECGDGCKCNANKCENRVVQRGLQVKLELIETGSKGYGVRTLTDIPADTFVTSYIGEIIDSKTAANRENFTYHLSLGKKQFGRNKASTSSTSSASSSKRARSDSDDIVVVQNFVSFFPMEFTWRHESDSESDSESDLRSEAEVEKTQEFIIDSLHSGNISRFFNHSCDPNLIEQRVFIGDDERFPEVAFFTKRLVTAGTELTFDYRYELNKDHNLKCHCKSKNCRKRLI